MILIWLIFQMNFSSNPPSNMRIQIQETMDGDGNPNDWLIIRIPYPVPNSIEVYTLSGVNRADKNLKKPLPIRDGVPENLTEYVG